MHAFADNIGVFAGRLKVVCFCAVLCIAGILLTSAAVTVISAGKVNLLGVSLEVVTSGSMSPAINTGDVVVVADSPTDDYNVGDVVTYEFSEDGRLVTHRLVAESNSGTFTIKGDANASADRHEITTSQIIGKVVATIPTGDAAGLFCMLGAAILTVALIHGTIAPKHPLKRVA